MTVGALHHGPGRIWPVHCHTLALASLWAAPLWHSGDLGDACAFGRCLSLCQSWETGILNLFVLRCVWVSLGNLASLELGHLWILDDQMVGGVRLLLASINLPLSNLAIREATNQASHAFQPSPLSLAVLLLSNNGLTSNGVRFILALVALCVGFTSVFGHDRTLARTTIHDILELIALRLPGAE